MEIGTGPDKQQKVNSSLKTKNKTGKANKQTKKKHGGGSMKLHV